MQGISEQKKKLLTIDDISPLWCKYFDMITDDITKVKVANYARKNNLDISRPWRCTVGEAWKFDADYCRVRSNGSFVCPECAIASFGRANIFNFDKVTSFMRMPYIIRRRNKHKKIEEEEEEEEEGWNWREHPIVTDFVKHWNEKHV